jgi:hypothetical protein
MRGAAPAAASAAKPSEAAMKLSVSRQWCDALPLAKKSAGENWNFHRLDD